MSQTTSLYERQSDVERHSLEALADGSAPEWAAAARGLAARFEEATGRDPVRTFTAATDLGNVLGLGGDELRLLGWSAALYDVGMLAVPEEVVGKGGHLQGGDLAQIRRHPLASAEMILAISAQLDRVAEAARTHHEHWDGRGYPVGLAGHEIPLHGRILAIVDTYDALTSFRPIRQGIFTDAAARDYLEAEAGKRFDPSLIRAFLGEVDLTDRRQRPGRPARQRKV